MIGADLGDIINSMEFDIAEVTNPEAEDEDEEEGEQDEDAGDDAGSDFQTVVAGESGGDQITTERAARGQAKLRKKNVELLSN